MFRRFIWISLVLVGTISANAQELPFWVDAVGVTKPSPGGIGAVTLEGDWLDTCIPDAISHSREGNSIYLEVTHPGINVGCGDAITPWRLTEEFGPLPPGEFEIFGQLVSVDPNNRSIREAVSGTDLLFSSFTILQGRFHGLGSLHADAYVSAATDVSADGRVVTGQNELAPGAAGIITREAFAWSPNTNMFSIGRLPDVIAGGSGGRGVSADGNTIVGESDARFGLEAFRWSLGNGMEGLGGIIEPAVSTAAAVSQHGHFVAGGSEFFPPITATSPDGPHNGLIPFPGVFREAFRWNEEQGAVGLGQVHPEGTSWATDISARGDVVVGNATLNPFIEIAYPDISEPFRWTEESGMIGLGHMDHPLLHVIDVAFPLQFETTAEAVSADGSHVVGTSRVINGTTGETFLTKAYSWTEDEGFVDLGMPATFLPGPFLPGVPDALLPPHGFGLFSDLRAVDASADGSIIVGTGEMDFTFFDNHSPEDSPNILPPGPFDESFSFIWDEANGMRILEDVLFSEYDFGVSGQLDGWQLGEVTAISDDGSTLVGTGVNPQGVQEAWRLVLGRVTMPGDADFDGDVDRADLDLILDSNGMKEDAQFTDGDFNFDGDVDGHDWMTALLAFGQDRAKAEAAVSGVAAIPEPTSGLLAVMAAILSATLWRRRQQ